MSWASLSASLQRRPTFTEARERGQPIASFGVVRAGRSNPSSIPDQAGGPARHVFLLVATASHEPSTLESFNIGGR